MSTLDIAHFKEVLGRYATGVVVVTAMHDEGPLGFTCQTFGSLSLEPMLVSFAATTASRSWPKIRRVGHLAINVLAADQEVVASSFAASTVDKFAGVAWRAGSSGAPVLEGAIATLEGRIESISTHGDHDIAVVSVDSASAHAGAPLVYFRGGFNVLA